MAIQRRVNFLSQQRVDVPDMRSIESSVSNDFDQLIQGFVTGTTQGYIMRGFNILMAGAIGSASSSLQMQVDPGAVLHIAASQSGTVLMVPSGTPAQQLNGATNTNVSGAFTPSSINYVTLDYIRFIDPTTSAQVYIWDPSSNTETTKIAPRAQILQFVINISTSTPTSNQLPIATVLTDSANLVVSITDARWLFCSLGTGGLTPDPNYSYPWTQGRTEPPVTSTSDSVDPFSGGDKNIGNLKELLNAMMTTFKEIKGTPYWFTEGTVPSFPSLYQNAALNVLAGGTWVVPSLGNLQLKGGSEVVRFGFNNPLTLSPFGPLLSTEALTAAVTQNTVVTFSTPAVDTINIGDTVTIGASTLDINTVTSQSVVKVDEPGFSNGTGQSASLKHYGTFDLTAEQVLYVLFPESDISVTYGYGDDGATPILPKQISAVSTSTITVATGGNYSTGPGNLLAHGQSFSYTSYSPGTGVFAGVSPNPLSTVDVNDYVYQLDSSNIGYYHFSDANVVPGIDPLGVSLGSERVYWLAYYDGSSNIILRNAVLAVGESIAVGDTISTAILSYIGMPNQTTNNPSYTSNIRGIANENLTARIGTLTDAIGDEQEDRSAYMRSSDPVTWDGATLTFSSDIVIEIINTKGGLVTTHTIAAGTIALPIAGYTAWVTINRDVVGNEALTVNIAPASAIPAQTQANKDVFVLFKAVGTSGSAFLYLPFIKQLINPGQTVRIGASGSGTGGGGGDFGLQSTNFKTVFEDTFDVIPTLTGSAIDTTNTKATYSVANQYFNLAYDASKTVVSGPSTTIVMSAAPTFTVQAGDLVVVGSQARKITIVNSQTNYTIEAAFSADPSGSAANVCQAVHTVDLNNFSFNGRAASYVFPGSNIGSVLVDYEDAASGSLFESITTPNIAMVASSTGAASDYSVKSVRPLNLDLVEATVSLPSVGANLYIRFFPNKTSGSGSVNLLEYKAFFHAETGVDNTGFALSQAYGYLNASVTPVNCSQPTVVGGKTQIVLNFTYTPGLNTGTANGQLWVEINGQKVPRYIDAVRTPDASYTETNNNTITLNADYSVYAESFEIIKLTAVIDTNSSNASKLSSLYSIIVGSAADVSAGVANYSSLVTALGVVPVNGNILVLKSYNTSESITVSTACTIEGQGRGTNIAGTFTVSSTFASIFKMKFSNTVSISGTSNYVRDCFAAPGVSVSETTPGSNSLLIIGE